MIDILPVSNMVQACEGPKIDLMFVPAHVVGGLDASIQNVDLLHHHHPVLDTCISIKLPFTCCICFSSSS